MNLPKFDGIKLKLTLMRVVLISLLLLFSQKIILAQGSINVGIIGAFNTTWLLNKSITTDRSVKYVFSFGKNVGIKLGYHINDRTEFMLNLNHCTITQEFQDKQQMEDWRKETYLDYLDIPLLMRINEINRLLHVEFGFQYSFLLKAKEKFVSNPSSILYDYDEPDAKHRYESTNFSVVMGGGILCAKGKHAKLYVGLRTSFGILDLLSTTGGKGERYPYYFFPGYTPQTLTLTYTPTKTFYGGILCEVKFF